MEGRKAFGWAARDTSGILSPYSFNLRKTGSEDVVLKVLYCGVDHTDLHQMRNEIHSTNYPLVPGHEVVGEVVELGSELGPVENACLANPTWSNIATTKIFTFNDTNKDGSPTRGGFSSAMVVHQRFVVRIPKKLAPDQAAPLLCAGVTAYSPLKQFMGSNKVLNAGILGLGGVGHLGVLIAKAMGHHVTVISSSDKKREEALEILGADAFLVSSNAAEMEGAANSLDYILDTVPALHPLRSYLSLLKVDGKLIIVAAVPKPLQFDAVDIILGKRTITGSFIGSMEETQEILEFWADKGLKSFIETVTMDYVNEAFERMERNDVRFRFVLDVAGSNLE
ncbi:unnamed protein product [Prunus armeniaca]